MLKYDTTAFPLLSRHENVAYEAARFAKERAKGDIIEIVDLATGTKIVMLEDGRTGR
jgi:hypothetical protein